MRAEENFSACPTLIEHRGRRRLRPKLCLRVCCGMLFLIPKLITGEKRRPRTILPVHALTRACVRRGVERNLPNGRCAIAANLFVATAVIFVLLWPFSTSAFNSIDAWAGYQFSIAGSRFSVRLRADARSEERRVGKEC